MRIVAVVCAYWPSRSGNVQRIVADLQAGARPPDRILVLNNNAELSLEVTGAEVIHSQFNSRCRGKFICALLDPADYYVLLDDDTSVGRLTVSRYAAEAHPECCWGYCGVAYETGNGVRTYPNQIESETPCQYFLGCGLFVSYRSLVNMAALEERVRVKLPDDAPPEWKHCGDDILIGLANKASILPLSGEERFVDLDWGNEAMAWGHDGVTKGSLDYLILRDKFTEHALAVMQNK